MLRGRLRIMLIASISLMLSFAIASTYKGVHKAKKTCSAADDEPNWLLVTFISVSYLNFLDSSTKFWDKIKSKEKIFGAGLWSITQCSHVLSHTLLNMYTPCWDNCNDLICFSNLQQEVELCMTLTLIDFEKLYQLT